jgi:hypothetical protein
VKVVKYVIEYEHLQDELVTNEKSRWYFNKVKDEANKYKLELSDEDFKRFLKLKVSDKDTGWVMHKMSAYEMSLTDALITYINY